MGSANRIPSNADPELRTALNLIWEALDRLTGVNNIDLKGRRVANAGDAVDPQDYTTLAQVQALIDEAVP